MALLIFDVVLVSNLFRLFIGADLAKVHAGVFLHRVNHGDAAEGLFHINDRAVIAEYCAAADGLCQMAEHLLGQVHHAVVVGVGLIQLHQGKFRIVSGIHALIAEDAADLIDALKAAHDQSLQVKLQRNAELSVLIQGIVVGDEGTGCRTAGILHQHGGFHLHEALVIQEPADLTDDAGSLDEGILHLRIHDEVHVSLAETHIRVGKAMVLLRKNLQALGEKSDLLCVNGDFPGLGLEHIAADTDDVADIVLLEILVGLFSYAVSCHIALDVAGLVLHIAEGSLTHDALGHHASGDSHLFAFQLIELLFDIGAVSCHVKLRDGKRILACCLKLRKLLAANL